MTLLKQKEYVRQRQETKKESERLKEQRALLVTSKQGGVEGAEGVLSTADMEAHLDIGTKAKAYALQMDHGPYAVRYTPSGDAMLCVGKTDVVGVNTLSLFPLCEREVGDTIHDGVFLHRSTFFALAQSKCVYIYNQAGVEVHALRDHTNVQRVAYLQDHFLLATLTAGGWLKYQDTTVGKLVSEIGTKQRESVLEHDRTNGVVYLSNPSGEVSLWSPRSTEYLAKVLCHRSRISNVKVSDSGAQMYTSSGNELSVWDVRNTFSPVCTKTFPGQITALSVSQTGQVSLSQKNKVLVLDGSLSPVITHSLGRSRVHSLAYMPYEDILSIGSDAGVENIVSPGAGQSVYRRNENPRVSSKEKRNAEVRRMLEKIPADMISLENEVGTEVKEVFTEEILPMKIETPAGKVRRLMKMRYG
ncbi:U3 small nucleolar RNA-associated protein 7 [Nematocida sp. AWRm77]|nr:U3 small nucleolar RNA-associated protein 7 [Nematocida sp. AWRm77]